MMGILYFDSEVFVDRESIRIPGELYLHSPLEGPDACLACGLGSLPEVRTGGWRAPKKQ